MTIKYSEKVKQKFEKYRQKEMELLEGDDIRKLHPYKPPIQIIMEEYEMTIVNGMAKATQEIGIKIDKEELIKALKYDREQYEKGYQDGLKQGYLGAYNDAEREAEWRGYENGYMMALVQDEKEARKWLISNVKKDPKELIKLLKGLEKRVREMIGDEDAISTEEEQVP